MSKEEAMKLPLDQRPICFRISSEMYHAVFEAVGAASMAWKPNTGDAVFNSEAAEKIAVELCFAIAKEVETIKDEWICVRDRYPDRDVYVLVWDSESQVAYQRHGNEDMHHYHTHWKPMPGCPQ